MCFICGLLYSDGYLDRPAVSTTTIFGTLMIIALDVFYSDDHACVAAVAFEDWGDDTPATTWVTEVTEVEDYEPGSFYRRELPCLIAAVDASPDEVRQQLTTVIVDGYVWLDADGRAGLGAHLYEELDQAVAIVGVAKNEFRGNDAAIAVVRGSSIRPLFVTAAGTDVDVAAERLREMHGPHRMPTLLRAVDQLSRRC